MGQFVHLHLHTEYSLVDSIVRIPGLMEAVRAQGMASVALTDVNNLFALVKFYRAALRCGIKPVIGLEARVSGLSPDEPDSSLVLLCKNNAGYGALSRILTRSYLESEHVSGPVVQRGWLTEAGADLIVLSGAREGDVGKALLAGDKGLAAAHADFWSSHFPDSYYLELQRTGREEEEQYLGEVLELAAKRSLPVVASNDVRFLRRQDFEAHEARVCIQTGCILEDARRPHLYSDQQYLRSAEEMEALFSDIPEAVANSVENCKALQRDAELRRQRVAEISDSGCPDPAGIHPHRSRTGTVRAYAAIRFRPPAGKRRLWETAGPRAGGHQLDGLRRVFPHRRGLHPLGQGKRHPGGSGQGFGRRLAGVLRARHHRHRSPAVRPAVRALPESRTHLHAGLRHRFLHGQPRPRDRIRGAALRPVPRQPDHHLRQHGGARGGARRRPGARLSVRVHRPHCQADSVRGRHDPGQGAGTRAGVAGAV